jgi:RNA 3'-terminal phosphate cyclase (ATP)
MLTIDGSAGEGGGQVLRTSLALSLCTGQPFRIVDIRAKRRKPGLQPQHLAAVRAAANLGEAEVEGATRGSQTLSFVPKLIRPGEYHFSVGTAGSTTLVLQTLLPALLTADTPSTLVLEGGTHNPLAPPFDFLARSFLPLVRRIGPKVEARLERPGFYPAGGGRFVVSIEPAPRLKPIELNERGALLDKRAEALLAGLPLHIAERELAVVGKALGWQDEFLEVLHLPGECGPGNVLLLTLEYEHVTEVFTGFGRRGYPAEAVAKETLSQAQRYLESRAAVGEHLADQLLLPLALAGGGSFTTVTPSNHTRTNSTVIEQFLPFQFECREIRPEFWRIAGA